MRLTDKQIAEIVVGAVSVKRSGDVLLFSKCTEEQVAAWAALNETLGKTALSTTGIRFDFHTNATTIRLITKDLWKLEIHVDGKIRDCVIVKDEEADGFSYQLHLVDDDTDKRVQIIFPSHNYGKLYAMEISDGAYVKPHKHSCKLLFIGDSITQGWDTAYDSLSWAWRVTRWLDANSVIQGVGGGFFDVSTLLPLPFTPDMVFLAYGTNDFHRFICLEDFRREVNVYLEKLCRMYSCPKLAVLPIPRQDNAICRQGFGSFDELRAILKEQYLAFEIPFVDGYDLLPNLPFFYADAVHPNDNGYALIFENLLKETDDFSFLRKLSN